jgi:hypothetical protein
MDGSTLRNMAIGDPGGGMWARTFEDYGEGIHSNRYKLVVDLLRGNPPHFLVQNHM